MAMMGDDDTTNWGDSTPPLPARFEQFKAFQFFKYFQIAVLALLCIFIIIILLFEAYLSKEYLKETMPYVLPLFTFVLGMSTQTRNSN